MSAFAPPIGLLAELTHRCPLGCPYCSNPLQLDAKATELDTETWLRVFAEAGWLGVLHVHLSGGEPASRTDLVDLVAGCAQSGLYTNLITSGVGLNAKRMAALAAAGLDHVQLSIQDIEPVNADRIAGYQGAFERKREIARLVVENGLPLTVNFVLHRSNIEHVDALIALAVDMKARRVEMAHAQYYGWALANRAALQPEASQVRTAVAEVKRAQARYEGVIVIDHVAPDYHARFPKACMGGWARRSLNVTPSGRALPCHAAETIPGLEFWSVVDHSLAEIWASSPAFNAFRGTDWMPDLCRSCERRDIDFGGCRCQAMAFTGDASQTDPICTRSPHRDRVNAALNLETAASASPEYVYRR